jgi:hypothetical protein
MRKGGLNVGGRRHDASKVIRSYTHEATLMEIRIKVLKLLMEDRERGISANACKQKRQHRDLFEAEQG